MPTAVLDRVNVLGWAERSLLVFTDRQGRTIGDYAPTSVEQANAEEDESVVADLYLSILPAPDVTPGVSSIEEGSADDIPGEDLADVAVLHGPQEWIWVSLNQTPLKCSTILSLILT
jgi:hypothetical protein